MFFKLEFKPFGEHAILIEWKASRISEDVLHDVLNFKQKIIKNDAKFIVSINHAYCSLLIEYDYFEFDFNKNIEELKLLYEYDYNLTLSSSTLWKIPVCYDLSFGIDLEVLAQRKKLSVKEIIQLHSQTFYTVYFIGFLPGFLYLGGLDENLHFPRKATPRLKVEKGAVAIGGNQTGVYPNESPGGWNIIGNSPINFFDVSKETPCFAKAGDKLQFYAVSKKEYNNIKILAEAGVYQIESEVLNA